MQVRQLALELDVIMIGAGNVAGATGTCATAVNGLMQGGNDLWVLAHAEVIVGAPDGDIADRVTSMVPGLRKRPRHAFEIGKHPIAPLAAQAFQRRLEEVIVVHGRPRCVQTIAI